MPSKAAEFFIPPGNNLLQAFDRVKIKHLVIAEADLTTLRDFSPPLLTHTAADFLKAGLGFLANRGADDLIQEVGIKAWHAVNGPHFDFATMHWDPDSLKRVGAPPKVVRGLIQRPTVPQIMFQLNGEGDQMSLDRGFILAQPDFLDIANNRPVEAIAIVANLASRIRDVTRVPLQDMEHYEIRSDAMEAHILGWSRFQHPELSIPENNQALMQMFPAGAWTLPPGIMY